jgi:hypothetical protein
MRRLGQSVDWLLGRSLRHSPSSLQSVFGRLVFTGELEAVRFRSAEEGMCRRLSFHSSWGRIPA